MDSIIKGLRCLAVSLLVCNVALAHTDLEIQIEDLSRQIQASGPQAELLLRRGDLYRRHEDWQAAALDFALVREQTPDNTLVDWVEGRYKVDSGQWVDAELMLSRFLQTNPGHSGAHQVRAIARWNLNRPAEAAQDYADAITQSQQPGPSLYRSLVITHFASGNSGMADAIAAVNAGLGKFPREISLLGLGVDLSLVQLDLSAALNYMSKVPQRLYKLPQWRFRRAVWSCLEGDIDTASVTFSALLAEADHSGQHRAGTWVLPLESVSSLAENPKAGSCSAAVRDGLEALHP